jgi:hypothetical protein
MVGYIEIMDNNLQTFEIETIMINYAQRLAAHPPMQFITI